MKMKSMKITNFRSYESEVCIDFDNFTAIVGRNDIGKSTILEALDIFFNDGKGIIKLDKDDINKQGLANGNLEITMSICFEDLPEKIIIDSTNETTLKSEYLLNANNQLEIIKKYPSSGKAKIFVKANHPTNPQCANLLQKKDSELRTIIDTQGIECSNRNKNADMRAAIWRYYETELNLFEVDLDVTKGETKSLWDKLQNYLPLYSLFQSDRKNSDGDSEVQDPLKLAVKEILNDSELQKKLNEIAKEVETKLKEVSNRTLDKIREMNPEIANSLNPVIPSADSLKWPDVFKNVSISSDENIPINKRGSGVKRLILLNFFRAEAERRKQESDIPSIIYAIEEPETSQHSQHQRQLIRAFLTLAESPNTQILITTHSSNIVKELNFNHLRLVSKDKEVKTVLPVSKGWLPYPSLNEVNYLAFSELTEEYHNELYGLIEAEELISTYKNGKKQFNYIKKSVKGKTVEIRVVLTEYIRHQIHHPENTLNTRYTLEQLNESIRSMREFIGNHYIKITLEDSIQYYCTSYIKIIYSI